MCLQTCNKLKLWSCLLRLYILHLIDSYIPCKFKSIILCEIWNIYIFTVNQQKVGVAPYLNHEAVKYVPMLQHAVISVMCCGRQYFPTFSCKLYFFITMAGCMGLAICLFLSHTIYTYMASIIIAKVHPLFSMHYSDNSNKQPFSYTLH